MSTATSTPATDLAPSVRAPGEGETPTRPLAATGQLLRFMIRRDRVRAPAWVLGIIVAFAASVGSVIGLYSSPRELRDYADLAQSDAALKAIAGPGYGLSDPTQGAVVMNETGMYALIGVSLMCLFMVLRHTRAEEESDRAELVRSAPVGRYATLTAAFIWVTALNLAVTVGVAVALLAFGLDVAGSLAFALAAFGLGMVFTGVAGVAAQVASSARSATALAGATLGGFFLLRAAGDLGNQWVSWLSPLGWAENIRAYAGERWWVLLLLAATASTLLVGAVTLSAGRDLGAGFLRQRPGPARGSVRLASPLALAIRLQRGSVLAWTIGIGITGFFFGIIADHADNLLKNQAVADLLAQSGSGTPTESFLATIILMTALLASGFTVSSALRLRTEELAGRAEPTIAMSISRRRWASSHLIVSMAGSAAILLMAGLSAGIGYAVQVGDAGEILTLVGAAITMLPALAVLAGLTFALFGMRSRWAPLAWAGVALSVVVGLLAETLNLPQWLRDVSPFEHVPALPAAAFDLLPLAILAAVAAALVTIGSIAVARRDIG